MNTYKFSLYADEENPDVPVGTIVLTCEFMAKDIGAANQLGDEIFMAWGKVDPIKFVRRVMVWATEVELVR